MIGTAPEAYARDFHTRNRRKLLKQSKKGPRDWHVDPPMVKIFKDRYLSPDKTVEWTLYNIEALLKETDQDEAKARWEKTPQLSSIRLLLTQ